HRDLKPDNIMIGAFGEVFVMDWGLARNLKESEEEDAALRTAFKREDKPPSHQTELTRDGAALGTIGYMAPEQARGEEIDARVDQFALGAILGLVLTGRSVLGDYSLQRLEASLNGRITRPSELSLQVAPELDAIAVKALAPQRGFRYPDMQALAEDLRRYLSSEPVSVYDYRLSERVTLTVKRHPTLTVTLAAALLILTFIGWQRVHRRATLERFLAQGEQALRGQDPAAARSAFERARGIEDAASAKLGLQLTEQLEREQAHERAAALLEAAADALEGDRLDEARDLYARVKDLPGAEDEAQKGLRRVKLRALEIERERQQAATHQQLVERARGHVEVARRSLAAGEFQDAYVRLVQAMAFDLPEVRADVTPLLNEVNERRVLERVEQARQANRERALAYVEAGQSALGRERFGEARAQFERALGLDGENEDARAGLDLAFRGLSEEQQRRRQRGRLDEARKLLARGRALRQEARHRYRQREDLVVVLEGYFDALDKLQRGLSLHPASEPLRDERRELGSELAAVLRSEGQAPFADFVLRWCGSKARDTRRVLPRDPYLEVIEGDKVLIRQALGESTRFAPTKAFADVRRFVEKHANRYRFHVVIRSRITTIAQNPAPKVVLQAIDLKREDKKTRTFQILGQIPIEGTYVRHSQKSKVGRVVAALDEATDPSARGRRGSFPLERYVAKVREVVQTSLRDIGSGQRTWRPLAESWEVLDLVDLRLALQVPEGVRFRAGPSPGLGWKVLSTAYSGVAATLFVRNGKPPDEVELEQFVERRLGVRDSLWRELSGFRAGPGWDRVRALRAADASALQVGVFGVGGFGAYVLLLRTSDERYEADPGGFSKWLGSLRPDLRK
ncbi:MAG TPA: hypothetical protein DEA08_31705, partial [Planctomycetes bacterium]|nr:hypothetical protein [Planctomycetota bacterium]